MANTYQKECTLVMNLYASRQQFDEAKECLEQMKQKLLRL